VVLCELGGPARAPGRRNDLHLERRAGRNTGIETAYELVSRVYQRFLLLSASQAGGSGSGGVVGGADQLELMGQDRMYLLKLDVVPPPPLLGGFSTQMPRSASRETWELEVLWWLDRRVNRLRR